MPLRDHFRPPLDNIRHWEGFHAALPVMIVANLRPKMPRRYFAEPRVHSGGSIEIDVATIEKKDEELLVREVGDGNGGDATAVWIPPRPTLTFATDLPAQDVHEVRVYDEKDHCHLVAAIEIISPANKDCLGHRSAFVAKCADMLKERVSVVLMDMVTARSQNLYDELLALVGITETGATPTPPLYATSCRMTKREKNWKLETWVEPLDLGRPLSTMPLWLADNLAIPLELEQSYEQSCNILGIP